MNQVGFAQRRLFSFFTLLLLAIGTPAGGSVRGADEPKFVDLSLLVAPDRPCTWPAGFPTFQILHYERIGKLSPYNSDLLLFDEHTGTQFDAPTHSVAPPGSGLPNAGEFGTMSSEKVPAWQFGGEACVIDVRQLATSGPNGRSDFVTRDHVVSWEKKHRPLRFGDVALFRSDYSDRFYKPLPEGRRFLADPLDGIVPAWPDPNVDCMEYLASRHVFEAGTDSPSMGPIPPPLGDQTHYAGLRHGMIWTESATRLGRLPATGAFYCLLAPKVVNGVGAAGRGFAIVGGGQGGLTGRLIEAARHKRAIDLSVELTEDRPVWWPGRGAGRGRQPYLKSLVLPFKQQRHVMDSNTGTHLVPPAYSLPRADEKHPDYSAEVAGWLAEYESRFGPRGTSDITAEKVPISQTCGPIRVVDVRKLVGTTDRNDWPASPVVTAPFLKQFESDQGKFQPGEIVVLWTGHNDRFFKPMPDEKGCLADPLNGKSEGWPCLGPEGVDLLAQRGIRCVAIDAPTLGGVDPKRALWTYWRLGTKGIVGIEFLKNVERAPKNGYLVFACLKIADSHGSPGRALVFGLSP